MNKARIEPYMAIEHHLRRYNLQRSEEIGITPVVLVTWWERVAEKLAQALGALATPNWLYGELGNFYTTAGQAGAVCVVQMPIGAPGTVMIMDAMIAGGAQVFLGLGMAGGLQPQYPLGSLLVATEGISQEGTTRHYLPEETELKADPELCTTLATCAAEMGLSAALGPQWTTDAPFRELISQIEAFQAQGVLGVDMETSAMYALARYRGVRCANLLVVSDEMWQEWNPGFGGRVLEKGMGEGGKVTLAASRQIAARWYNTGGGSLR